MNKMIVKGIVSIFNSLQRTGNGGSRETKKLRKSPWNRYMNGVVYPYFCVKDYWDKISYL